MRKCAICEKSSRMAGTRILLRGHYNPTNWTRKYPNLQATHMPVAKAGFAVGEPVLACTQCIRTFGKTARLEKKAIVKAELAAKKAAAPVAEKKVEAPKAEKPKAKKEKAAPKAKKEAK